MCGLITLASSCLVPKHGDWGTANSVWSGLAERIIVGMWVICPDPLQSRFGWEISWLDQKMCQSGGISSYVVSSDEEERHLQLWCDVVGALTNKMAVHYSARKINCYSSSLWAKFLWIITTKKVSKAVAASNAHCINDSSCTKFCISAIRISLRRQIYCSSAWRRWFQQFWVIQLKWQWDQFQLFYLLYACTVYQLRSSADIIDQFAD